MKVGRIKRSTRGWKLPLSASKPHLSPKAQVEYFLTLLHLK